MSAHTCVVDLAGTCTGPGPCDTSSFGAGNNWVNKVGGLPDYIRAIAHSLQRDHGMSESRAISTAVATVKRWAAGGGGVTAATRARAAAALAEWEAKKTAAHSLTASPSAHTLDLGKRLADGLLDLAEPGHVYHWKHGWIPITPHAALQKAHGSHAGAARILHRNGQHEDAHAMLRAGVAHHEALGHVKTAARYRQALATREPHPAPHTLTHGDHATVRGVDQYGAPMTFTGRVSGRPTPVSVHKRGSTTGNPMLAVQMHNGSDTSGLDATARGVVYVPHQHAAPADKAPTMPSARAQGIEIAHTGDGTLVHGTSRNDGSGAVLKQHGFRWSSNLNAWYLPRNQHFSTRGTKVDNAERDLKAAGHDVTVTREAASTTSAAEREAAARARAAGRAEHMDTRAAKAAQEAESRRAASDRITDMIPMGQPILVGHHSEGRHRRDIARSHSHMEKSWEADRQAKEAKAAAERARATAAGDSPLLRQRRIDRNEAEIRKIDKTLAQHDIAVKKPEAAARFGIHPMSDQHLEQLRAARAELADQVAHDRSQIAASGHKTFTAADLKAGDLIKYRGRTHVVKKVNKTTVSVPTGYSWDDKVPINQITGHKKHADLPPEAQAKAKEIANLTAEPAATVDLAWTEQAHPRGGKGTAAGGKFVAKNAAPGAASTPAGMTGNVRDFQKRMGLPVTGVIDARTAAAITREAAAKAGGGKGKGKGKHAAKHKAKKPRKITAKVAAAHARATQRQAVGQHIATINSLTVAQRTEARRRMPVPPTGYVWGTDNTLRAVKMTRAQQTAPLTGI